MSNSTDAPAPTRIGLGRIVALYHLLILFIPKSLTYSVPLFLKRQCNRTLRKERFDAEGRGRGKVGRVDAVEAARLGLGRIAALDHRSSTL